MLFIASDSAAENYRRLMKAFVEANVFNKLATGSGWEIPMISPLVWELNSCKGHRHRTGWATQDETSLTRFEIHELGLDLGS